MKIKFTDEFKEGWLKVIDIIEKPSNFYRLLSKIINLLTQGYKTPPDFVIHPIKGHPNWFNCYLYRDAKNIIILQYLVEKDCVILLRIGPIEDFLIDFASNN